MFWCTRCERYFIANIDKQPGEAPSILFTREELTVDGWRCDGYSMSAMLEPPCAQAARFAVTQGNDIRFMCPACAENFVNDEGPDADCRPLSQFYNQVFQR